MTARSLRRIRELAETDHTVADPAADVRGRAVVDRDGHEIGRIDDLLIDDQAEQVLFLRVSEGGFLGIGATHYLVPVEAVAAVHPDRVQIDQWRDGMGDLPGYNPRLAPAAACHLTAYGWWGVPLQEGAYPR